MNPVSKKVKFTNFRSKINRESLFVGLMATKSNIYSLTIIYINRRCNWLTCNGYKFWGTFKRASCMIKSKREAPWYLQHWQFGYSPVLRDLPANSFKYLYIINVKKLNWQSSLVKTIFIVSMAWRTISLLNYYSP